MRRRAVYLMLGLSTVACACSGSDASAPKTSSSSPPANSTPSSTSASSTTTAPTTTTLPLPLAPAAAPADAARALIAAWKAGDRDAASAVATAAAVQQLFAAEPGSVQDRGCNQPPPDTPVLCVYRTAAGELQLRASPVPGGWIVDQAMLTEGN